MPRQRYFFGMGSPPFSFIAERLVEDEDFRASLQQIAGMSEDASKALAQTLATHEGFLDRSTLLRIVSAQATGKDAGIKKLVGILWRMAHILRESTDSPEEALESLRDALAKHGAELEAISVDQLIERLKALVIAPRAFTRQKKAENLAEATGFELSDVSLVCDLRPVFDDERKKIDGVIAVTTLRVEIVEPDGTSSVTECRLTERQIDDLCKISEAAKRKMHGLRDLLASKEIPLALASEPIAEKT